jgi:hypothetical protein
MTPQEFLLQECKNVAALLDQTLRHEYGLDGSQDFYDECVTRLKFIEGQISSTTDASVVEQWGYLRAVVDEIRVEGNSATISGSYERLIAAVANKNVGTEQVPTFMRDWHARQESNP